MMDFWLIPISLMLIIVGLFPPIAGYIVLVERKVLADMQVRLGPMRVGPHGLLQPLADALKLLLKEDIIPSASDRGVFYFAPIISMFTAFVAFGMVPFSDKFRIADVNVGLLVISAAASIGIRSPPRRPPQLRPTRQLRSRHGARPALWRHVRRQPQHGANRQEPTSPRPLVRLR